MTLAVLLEVYEKPPAFKITRDMEWDNVIALAPRKHLASEAPGKRAKKAFLSSAPHGLKDSDPFWSCKHIIPPSVLTYEWHHTHTCRVCDRSSATFEESFTMILQKLRLAMNGAAVNKGSQRLSFLCNGPGKMDYTQKQI